MRRQSKHPALAFLLLVALMPFLGVWITRALRRGDVVTYHRVDVGWMRGRLPGTEHQSPSASGGTVRYVGSSDGTRVAAVIALPAALPDDADAWRATVGEAEAVFRSAVPNQQYDELAVEEPLPNRFDISARRRDDDLRVAARLQKSAEAPWWILVMVSSASHEDAQSVLDTILEDLELRLPAPETPRMRPESRPAPPRSGSTGATDGNSGDSAVSDLFNNHSEE